jgi:hypothetical protein
MTSFSARHLRWPLSLLAVGAFLLSSATADADWLRDRVRQRSVPFCAIIYGPACKVSLHVDFGVGYLQSHLDHAWEERVRSTFEVGVLGRLGSSHLHFGAGAEVGEQNGDLRAGLHVTPRLRLRYFPARGPVALELGSGPMFQRMWMKNTNVPQFNRLGISNEVSVGVMGFAGVVAGADVLGAAGGVFGEEVQFYVAARLSIVAVIYLFVAKND